MNISKTLDLLRSSEFSFAYNDTLKKDNVKDYSINAVR